MVMSTTFISNKQREGVLQFLKKIHQGPQDTIIFHIQNEKVGVMVKNCQCCSYRASLWNGQNPRFLKNVVADILNAIDELSVGKGTMS